MSDIWPINQAYTVAPTVTGSYAEIQIIFGTVCSVFDTYTVATTGTGSYAEILIIFGTVCVVCLTHKPLLQLWQAPMRRFRLFLAQCVVCLTWRQWFGILNVIRNFLILYSNKNNVNLWPKTNKKLFFVFNLFWMHCLTKSEHFQDQHWITNFRSSS